MESRALNRENSKRKALRKQRICRDIYHFDWYDNLHQYSKNKVHCSCAMCSSKTNRKKHGKIRTTDFIKQKGNNYSLADYKRIKAMEYDESIMDP